MLNVGRMQYNLLEYSPEDINKIFSWSTLELVINKLKKLVIFTNSLVGRQMSPPYDPSGPINRGPPPCHAIYLRAW